MQLHIADQNYPIFCVFFNFYLAKRGASAPLPPLQVALLNVGWFIPGCLRLPWLGMRQSKKCFYVQIH